MMLLSQIDAWKEFGLAGAVIFSLFTVLIIIVRWLINHIDRQAETHKEERAEWRESNNEMVKKVDTSVQDLHSGITQLVDLVKETNRQRNER